MYQQKLFSCRNLQIIRRPLFGAFQQAQFANVAFERRRCSLDLRDADISVISWVDLFYDGLRPLASSTLFVSYQNKIWRRALGSRCPNQQSPWGTQRVINRYLCSVSPTRSSRNRSFTLITNDSKQSRLRRLKNGVSQGSVLTLLMPII